MAAPASRSAKSTVAPPPVLGVMISWPFRMRADPCNVRPVRFGTTKEFVYDPPRTVVAESEAKTIFVNK